MTNQQSTFDIKILEVYMMQGIEKAFGNDCLKALIAAWQSLMESSASETLAKTEYGKGDTLGFDAIPEIIIRKRISQLDSSAILLTEELDDSAKKRWPTDADPARQPLMFFSDPTDRSKQLKLFLEKISCDRPIAKVGDLMGDQDCVAVWEELFEKPAIITGATSSITCVRKGKIIFSLMLNYITRTVFTATPEGTNYLKLPEFTSPKIEAINLDYVLEHGQTLIFPPAKITCRKPDDYKRFVTFLGKSGYLENFNDCMMFVENPDQFLHHREPGGPARILYLSALQKDFGPIGFIMANGEKIGEWIHWLAFAKFAKRQESGIGLKVFEISIKRPWTKEGVLMSTSPPYSIFCSDGDKPHLDLSRLRNFAIPNRFRSMLVVLPEDNERIIHVMHRHQYREISTSF